MATATEPVHPRLQKRDYPSGEGWEKGMATPEEKLPFDPRTLLLGLWRRRRALGAVFLGSCLLGVAAGLLLGGQLYEAETLLLYNPVEGTSSSLPTLLNMVKVRSNLAGVRKRLHLDCTLEALGSACDVRIYPDTDLMSIRARWTSAVGVAAIANTLREVFVDSQQDLEQRVLASQIRDLEEHLGAVARQLGEALAAFQEYAGTADGGEVEAKVQSYLDEFARIDRLYKQAQVEKEFTDLTGNSLIDLGAGASPSPADKVEGLAENDLRIQGLISAIREDKTYRASLAELAQAENEFKRAQQLIKQGLISEQEYQGIRTAYEKQKALVSDTEQTRKWKEKLGQLRAERLQQLDEARKRLKVNLPRLQRQREVEFWEAEKQNLEEKIAQLRRAYESKMPQFSIVAEAQPPAMPSASNRRLIALGVAFVGVMAGFAFALARELLDTTIKSAAELSLKLPFPLLGVLPQFPAGRPLFPGKTEPGLIGSFRGTAQRLRQLVPHRGARILVVSAGSGEGATLVATNLAACFGRLDERVLLVDAQDHVKGEREVQEYLEAGPPQLLVDDQLWAERERHVSCDLVLHNGQQLKGLGEYLSFETEQVEEIVWPTALPGVECIPRVGDAVIPDLVCSHRMRELLEETSAHFSLVLIDAPPVLAHIDAESLAQWSDAILLVVRSRTSPAAALREALERLRPSGAPVVGVVLNGVDPLYLESAWKGQDR